MHLLVLSAFRLMGFASSAFGQTVSQCTFWCSVLSDVVAGRGAWLFAGGLNAPFGAQCFPTWRRVVVGPWRWGVSMHLLVLSAFRHLYDRALTGSATMSQCTFWCSVLSDSGSVPTSTWRWYGLNAPFGAQCFPTRFRREFLDMREAVSMHLLVLSAFRQQRLVFAGRKALCLNAPFGAQCFPT